MLTMRTDSARVVSPSRMESPSQTRIFAGSHDSTQSMI
ncbi:hypothetical protein RHIZO_02208 [Rhizobiaceae bacterium]|nr:hypothetical protein RHIZO_02208 [Rhizobiaceae bacterium]